MHTILWALLTVLLSCGFAWADPVDSSAEIENLKERIRALEAKTGTPVEGEQPFTLLALGKHLRFSGLFELEAGYHKSDGQASQSDLVLATAQLSTAAAINDHIGGHLSLLFEEGETEPVEVDEAVISLHCPQYLFGQRLGFHGGRMYLPFGRFNSAMISDPLTLELGETRNTAAELSLEGEFWSLSAGAFSGEVGDSSQKKIDALVAALTLTPWEGLSFGASYLSDLGESDSELVAVPALHRSGVAAASAFIALGLGPFSLEGEWLGALDDFDPALVGSSALTGQRPQAWGLEASWAASQRLQLALRAEEAGDFLDDLRRYGGTVSYGLFPNTLLALEYLHGRPDRGGDQQTLTAQLAFEF